MEAIAHNFLANAESESSPLSVSIYFCAFNDRLSPVGPNDNGGGIVENDFIDFGKGVGFTLTDFGDRSGSRDIFTELLKKSLCFGIGNSVFY